MKKVEIRFNYLLLILILGVVFLAYSSPQDKKDGGPWDIPTKYEEMKNPYTGDENLLSIGKSMYARHCKACHGSNGLGDGIRAVALKTDPGDFTTEEFKNQVPGLIYYKSIIGRDEMPNFETKISNEKDRWAIITYVLTFEK
jgi:mono/diheme cytochrome c family protein